MLSTRVGTDLAQVEGVEHALRHFGRRYLRRIYTPAEIAYCEAGGAEMPRRLAARFAAKEACLKVLRAGDGGLGWRSMEVVKQPGGWCELALHGAARQQAARAGLRDFSVSLSHEGPHAMAVVSAMLDTDPYPKESP